MELLLLSAIIYSSHVPIIFILINSNPTPRKLFLFQSLCVKNYSKNLKMQILQRKKLHITYTSNFQQQVTYQIRVSLGIVERSHFNLGFFYNQDSSKRSKKKIVVYPSQNYMDSQQLVNIKIQRYQSVGQLYLKSIPTTHILSCRMSTYVRLSGSPILIKDSHQNYKIVGVHTHRGLSDSYNSGLYFDKQTLNTIQQWANQQKQEFTKKKNFFILSSFFRKRQCSQGLKVNDSQMQQLDVSYYEQAKRFQNQDLSCDQLNFSNIQQDYKINRLQKEITIYLMISMISKIRVVKSVFNLNPIHSKWPKGFKLYIHLFFKEHNQHLNFSRGYLPKLATMSFIILNPISHRIMKRILLLLSKWSFATMIIQIFLMEQYLEISNYQYHSQSIEIYLYSSNAYCICQQWEHPKCSLSLFSLKNLATSIGCKKISLISLKGNQSFTAISSKENCQTNKLEIFCSPILFTQLLSQLYVQNSLPQTIKLSFQLESYLQFSDFTMIQELHLIDELAGIYYKVFVLFFIKIKYLFLIIWLDLYPLNIQDIFDHLLLQFWANQSNISSYFSVHLSLLIYLLRWLANIYLHCPNVRKQAPFDFKNSSKAIDFHSGFFQFPSYFWRSCLNNYISQYSHFFLGNFSV